MKKSYKNGLKFAIIGLLAVSSATAAIAQVTNLPMPRVAPKLTNATGNLAIQSSSSLVTAQQSTIIGQALIAPSVQFKAGSALSGFDFSFKNGDHKIRQISVLQNGPAAELTFADQDSNDPFFGAASWLTNSAFKSAEISAAGGGEFDIPITPMAEHTAVIKGFAFIRKDGSDANVRSIGVRINPEGNKIRVNLIDDQGIDMRGYERTIAAGIAMVFQPYGIIAGTSFAVGDAIKMVAEHEFNNSMRQFAVTVQYTWVPNSMVASTGAMSGSGDEFESGQRPGPKSVIQGFLFQFRNYDHHLLALRTTFGDGGTISPRVHFQDGDKDDPKQWFVNYVNIKD